MPQAVTIVALLGAVFLLWRFLPVGKLHGRTIRLHEWPRWRVNLRAERRARQLAAADALEGEAKLEALKKLLRSHPDSALDPWDNTLMSLAETGSDQTLDFLIDCLRDLPLRTAGKILRGIKRAAKAERGSAVWRQRLFDALSPHLDSEEFVWKDVPDVLLVLDRVRATDLLTSGPGFSPDHPSLADRLHALSLADVDLPREKLVPFFESLTQPGPADGQASIQFLKLWARPEPAEARRLLRVMAWSEEPHAMDAAEALLEIDNLPHPRFGVDDFVAAEGFANVPPEVQTVWLVDSHYCYPLSCGSLVRFFKGESGDRFAEVVDALERIGAKRHAMRLRAAGALFGPGGPSRESDLRNERIAVMNPPLEGALETLINEWSRLEPEALLNLRYMITNASVFRALKDTRTTR